MGTPTPFGRWPSPLDPRTVAAQRRSRSSLASDGQALYWVESRPEEGGRQVVVRAGLPAVDHAAEAGASVPADVTPPAASVRSRVHEYGGGAYCLLPPDGQPGTPTPLAWVEQADQRIRLLRGGGEPIDLSPEPPEGERWAHGDLRATADGRWVLCVRERHAQGVRPAVHRELVAYAAPRPVEEVGQQPASGAASGGVVLASGRDFYAAPRPDPSGHRLAWTCWDHPDMPWDASEVWAGELVAVGTDGLEVQGAQRVDGGHAAPGGADEDAVSVGQPVWDVAGGLVYMADRGGWWRPWRWHPGGGARQLVDDEAEYHGPDWALGQSTVAPLPGGTLACRRRRDGSDQLVLLDPADGTWEALAQPCVTIGAVCAHRDGVAWLGATPSDPAAPWWWPATAASTRPSTATAGLPTATARPLIAGDRLLPPGDVSPARPFSCEGRTGPVHGLYYAPRLLGVQGPPGERPPLVVQCHGGPTGAAEPGFDPLVQYFTTRGFAVAAVDYTGSTGYGRSYRQALAGRWGEADVDDCADAARYLAAEGLVDGRHMAIRGSSAGGLTALGALVRADVFAAAVAWYGVTDLVALAAATHDFEAHYTDRLVGPLPEAAAEYRRRSPVHRTADVTGAVLLFQGLDDPVVPPGQATAMAEALRARGHPCDLVTFPGESHGFRRAETVERCLTLELDFYRRWLCPS